jgi:hypothetical protein
VTLDARCQRMQRQLAQPRQLSGIGYLDSLAAHQNAPSGACSRIGAVDLKCHPASRTGGSEFGPFVAAEHDHVPVRDVIHRENHRPPGINDGDPAHALPRKQLKALRLRHFLPAGLTGGSFTRH